MSAMAAMAPHEYAGMVDENQGPTILAATLTVTIAALITTVTRMYVRIGMIKNVGWDDYVMISAMMLCFVGQVIIIPQVVLGAGRHKPFIDDKDFATAFKLNFITQPLYLFAICLVKVSVGFFLLRVAVAKIYRRTIIGIMIFMMIYTTGCFFTIVLQCTNLAVQWDPTVKATCWQASTIKTLSAVNVGFNITTDLLFSIIIPIPLLWSLQMNKRTKTSLLAIFSLGIFATIAALIKVTFLPSYGLTGDWLWDSRNLTIWTVIESNIGIIAGNLPCLKPLFRAVLGSTYGRGSRKSTVNRYLSRAYGANAPRDAYMLTTINAGDKADDDKSVRMGSAGQESYDSLARTFSGIKAVTEVNITETSGPSNANDDRTRIERKQADMV